jgi:hypothetical protein
MRTSKGKTPRVSKPVAAQPDTPTPTVAPVTGQIRVRSRGNSAIHPMHHHEDRQASIAEAAYFLSEQRGFAPGHELEDWLAAEEEVDQRLIGEVRAS